MRELVKVLWKIEDLQDLVKVTSISRVIHRAEVEKEMQGRSPDQGNRITTREYKGPSKEL